MNPQGTPGKCRIYFYYTSPLDYENTGNDPSAYHTPTENLKLYNVYFGYHGRLPGKATVELAVDKKYNGKALNFYYYNAAKKQLETIATGLNVKDGRVSVSITHCSDYILSPVALNSTAVTSQIVNNPETGAVNNTAPAIAVAVACCLGAIAILSVHKPE